ENHKRDLDGAIDSMERGGGVPIWPRKLWKPVLRDEYIDLGEALAGTTLAKPTATKAVTNRVAWLQAWYAYKEAVCFVFADRRNELQAYKLHVQRHFNNFPGYLQPNIIRYDKAVRQ
ncbi:hypothetical protein BT96DRAFT_739296, partial [Gymnopus androsaceus JB14]